MTVLDIIAEGLVNHKLVRNAKERQERFEELLETVGLNKEHANRFPHEFSGGQRQRIGIARALAVEPEFIIADGPISAVDVTIQAQVVNLVKKLQRDFELTYLFIAHDLSMVKYLSDRSGIMYFGNIVELVDSDELYKNPIHLYTNHCYRRYHYRTLSMNAVVKELPMIHRFIIQMKHLSLEKLNLDTG